MTNTFEDTLTNLNDAWTDRLDALEQQLPPIPSKALAATRSSARRVNDVVESAACSLRTRASSVGDDASAAVATSTGQARAAAERSSATIESGVKQTTGQARAAASKTAGAVKRGASETAGQARSNVERTTAAVKKGVSETAGQVKAQARRTTESAANEVEGALDDAKVATDPGDYASWSKADLYERAQELDIDGRSGMTKAELVGALQKS